MATHSQTIVTINKTDGALGEVNGYSTSDTSMLQGIFPASPLNTGVITDETITSEYQDALDKMINDGGHTFGTFDPNFVDAPDMSKVETGDGGLPASPYVPNPTSPGPGSMNPTDQPKAPDGFGTSPNDTPFVGNGSEDNPSTTSAQIAGTKLGDFLMGKSIKQG